MTEMATSYIGIFFEAFGVGYNVGDERAYALHIFFRGHSLQCVILALHKELPKSINASL